MSSRASRRCSDCPSVGDRRQGAGCRGELARVRRTVTRREDVAQRRAVPALGNRQAGRLGRASGSCRTASEGCRGGQRDGDETLDRREGRQGASRAEGMQAELVSSSTGTAPRTSPSCTACRAWPSDPGLLRDLRLGDVLHPRPSPSGTAHRCRSGASAAPPATGAPARQPDRACRAGTGRDPATRRPRCHRRAGRRQRPARAASAVRRRPRPPSRPRGRLPPCPAGARAPRGTGQLASRAGALVRAGASAAADWGRPNR